MGEGLVAKPATVGRAAEIACPALFCTVHRLARHRAHGSRCMWRRTTEAWIQTSLVRSSRRAVASAAAHAHSGLATLRFPELDPNASITSVGVNQFVLCAGGLSKTMFLLNIPSDLVVLHACEASRDLPVLVVTCTLTGAAARAAAASSGGAPRSRSSFAVRLEHTSASTTSPAGGTVVSTPLAAPGS